MLHEKIEVEEETTEATATINEPEPEEDEPLEYGRYQLLERLFRFIGTDEKPLNDVLSGYFTKLMTVLLNRK